MLKKTGYDLVYINICTDEYLRVKKIKQFSRFFSYKTLVYFYIAYCRVFAKSVNWHKPWLGVYIYIYNIYVIYNLLNTAEYTTDIR